MPGFSLVLHSHIPYCRQAGTWPHGEEWIHEAIAETYVPLLSVLWDLHADQVAFHLVVGLTPVLVEQLADPDIQVRFVEYARRRIDAADADVRRFGAEGDEPSDTLCALAAWYATWYRSVLEAFQDRFAADLVGAFRALQDAGRVDIMTSAATHGYLPLLATDESIAGQLATGVRAYQRHFGRPPRTFWLPECAYRPGYVDRGGSQTVTRPGLESHLERFGLEVFFVETHAVAGGVPVGKAADATIGPYAPLPSRELVPIDGDLAPGEMSTFTPYRVGASAVAAIARDNRTSMQVWAAATGYPGDPVYREFHRKDAGSGMQYWKVTGGDLDLGAKALYDPHEARNRAREHARHFAGVVADTAQDFARELGEGLVVAMYDTELFGHWWFEGPTWLAEVLRRLSADPTVELTTPAAWLEAHPARVAAAIPESSWGTGGTHHTWNNPNNAWVWPLVHAAEARMRGLAARFPDAEPQRAALLNQTARELLLLQSSDWPFLISTGQAAEYATMRFTEHAAQFNRLAFLADQRELRAEVRDIVRSAWEQDNVFPDIDYRDWAPSAT